MECSQPTARKCGVIDRELGEGLGMQNMIVTDGD